MLPTAQTSCRLTTNENSNQTESTYHHKEERHCTSRGTTTNNRRERGPANGSISHGDLISGRPTNVTRACRPSSTSPSATAQSHRRAPDQRGSQTVVDVAKRLGMKCSHHHQDSQGGSLTVCTSQGNPGGFALRAAQEKGEKKG